MDRVAMDVDVRPVRDRAELERALALVHDNYVRCGYMQEHPSGLRVSPFFAMPTTQTYVTAVDEKVVATVTLFYDSPMLLPTDAIFEDALLPLRQAGRRIVEVGMLADRRRALQRSMKVVLRMMKRVFWAGRLDGIHDMVITVNPRHAAFYQRLLCFEPMSPVRPYPAVGNAPAVLLRVNFAELDPEQAQNPDIREMFLRPISAEEQSQELYTPTTEDLTYLAGRCPDAFSGLTQQQRAVIQSHHPELVLPQGEPSAVAAAS